MQAGEPTHSYPAVLAGSREGEGEELNGGYARPNTRPSLPKGRIWCSLQYLIFLDHLEQNCRHNRHDSQCHMETNHEIISAGCSQLESNMPNM